MHIETRHGMFQKITIIDNYVMVRCRACNLLYLVRAVPSRMDRDQEARYYAAQLPNYCPCRFVSTRDIKSPIRDLNDDQRRLRHGEGLSVFDLSADDDQQTQGAVT